MLQSLCVINLPPERKLPDSLIRSDLFIIETCQRNLIVGFNQKPLLACQVAPEDYTRRVGVDAYQYLLEVICGLKSKMLGENEISGQFKTAYKNYLQHQTPNSHIMRIIEKLFKDAKLIRTEHLRCIGQQSYAGLSRQILLSQENWNQTLILGSGALAADLLQALSKNGKIFICARNKARIRDLAETHQVEVIPWEERESRLAEFPFIINTIGTETTLYPSSFFQKWANINPYGRCFIDLGSPSAIDQALEDEKCLYRLKDIFAIGKELDAKKEQKIKSALVAISTTAEKRIQTSQFNLPYGWDELMFA